MGTSGQSNGAVAGHEGSGTAVPLSELGTGRFGIVSEAMLDPTDAALLRAMGLRPKARVRVCRLGEPCIVEVFGTCPGGCGCRIGLSLELARRVMIAPEPGFIAPEPAIVPK